MGGGSALPLTTATTTTTTTTTTSFALVYTEAGKGERGRKNFRAIFNLKNSTFQFLVRKILAVPSYFTNCPQILFLYLAVKNISLIFTNWLIFKIPEIQKLFVNNIDFSPSKYKSGKQNHEILLSTNFDATFTK